MKSKVDIIDANKLETLLTNLSKFSNVVKSNVIKNTPYDELVKKRLYFFFRQTKIPDTNTFIKTQEWEKHRKYLQLKHKYKMI